MKLVEIEIQDLDQAPKLPTGAMNTNKVEELLAEKNNFINKLSKEIEVKI